MQDELWDLNKKFTDFVIKPEEKVCTGIDRLNGIVQKLTQHNQPPTDAVELSKTVLEMVPCLARIWVVTTCKRYDKAMDLTHPKCGRVGHSQVNCWKRKRSTDSSA